MTRPLEQHVREERKRKALTQEKLAEKANVTTKTIQRIERGNYPAGGATRRVLKALQLDPDELIKGEPDSAGRRRSVKRVNDGQELARLFMNSTRERTIMDVRPEPPDGPIHSAVAQICDALDRLGRLERNRCSTREQYDCGRLLGEGLRSLEKKRWTLDLQQETEEVYGKDWDEEHYWVIRVHPTDENEGARS